MLAPNNAAYITEAMREVVELLNDLENFTGVGSINYLMPRRAGAGMEAPDGWLWLEPEVKLTGIAIILRDLCNLRVLRCTYRMITGNTARVRIYILPQDVGRKMIPRTSTKIRGHMRKLMEGIDVSRRGWDGLPVGPDEYRQLFEPDPQRESLFYLFNTIPSPKPDPDDINIKDGEVRYLIHEVLNEGKIRGMKSVPYQYQRRSIAMMLQRELAPGRTIDSRLREIYAPSGEIYYLDFGTMQLYQEPSYFDDVRGGILAEEMGTGKTLICLGVILATKNQYAGIPEEHSLVQPKRRGPGSLMELCVSFVWKNNISWRDHLSEENERCWNQLQNNHGYYEVEPAARSRSQRYTGSTEKERIFQGSGTIVVCPPNLVGQWRSEISKHVDPGVLKVLVLEHANSEIPAVHKLLGYDVVIFSKTRFDAEDHEGKDAVGRMEVGGTPLKCRCPYIGASRVPDCRCFKKDGVYQSPLLRIRWKRIIVDEGHTMGSAKTKGVMLAEKLPVERRWIVSGTPSSGLLGAGAGITCTENENEKDLKAKRDSYLEERKFFREVEQDDVEKLGGMIRNFLRLRPWAPCAERGEQASWSAYITKGFMKQRGGYCTVVRQILHRVVIRHTAEDVEADVVLPPLYHKLIHLEPGYYEKVAMNMFLSQIAVNAVTSERVDQDYMFHPKNRGQLRLLVNNLYKQAGFYWTGHSIKDITKSAAIAQEHLQSESKQLMYSSVDKRLLHLAISSIEHALGSRRWREITETHEMGYFVHGLPKSSVDAWSPGFYEAMSAVPMIGAAPLLEMQKHVYENAYVEDIETSLANAGRVFQEAALQAKAKQTRGRVRNQKNPHEPAGTQKLTSRRLSIKPPPGIGILVTNGGSKTVSGLHTGLSGGNSSKEDFQTPVKSTLKSALKLASNDEEFLPANSPLAQANIIGTASIKLSYLLSSILKYHKDEKILVFYESDDIAMYLAQGLEILGIDYLAYAKSLKGIQKAQYIVAFHDTNRFRVLLMDLSQAAHGLNVCTASRVYFVNAVWTPSIEAQALKRAHRIGQTRPVHVETLVLSGTLEEEMVKRRNAMTYGELKDTNDSVVNDSGMREIISNLKFLRINIGAGDDESTNVAKMAEPLPIFGRGQRGGINRENDELLARAAARLKAGSGAEKANRKLAPPPPQRTGLRPVALPTMSYALAVARHPETVEWGSPSPSSPESSVFGGPVAKRTARTALGDDKEEPESCTPVQKKKKGVRFG